MRPSLHMCMCARVRARSGCPASASAAGSILRGYRMRGRDLIGFIGFIGDGCGSACVVFPEPVSPSMIRTCRKAQHSDSHIRSNQRKPCGANG